MTNGEERAIPSAMHVMVQRPILVYGVLLMRIGKTVCVHARVGGWAMHVMYKSLYAMSHANHA